MKRESHIHSVVKYFYVRMHIDTDPKPIIILVKSIKLKQKPDHMMDKNVALMVSVSVAPAQN